MKNIIIKPIRIFFLVFFLGITVWGVAQPEPPPDGSGNSASNELSGGGASIEGGLILLLSLSIIYAGIRTWPLRNKKEEKGLSNKILPAPCVLRQS